jgi:hypothetical protein
MPEGESPMEEYRPAELTPEALAAVQRLERELRVTLVAYTRPAEQRDPAPEPRH